MHPQIRQIGPGNCPICGMTLEPVKATAEVDENHELTDMTRRFWVGSGLTVLVLVLEMGGHIPALRMHELVSPQVSTWIQFALSTPIVLWAGWPFFQRSWALIVHRSLNMFSLIALGTGSAYLYSLFAAFAPGLFPAGFHGMGGTVPVYFEAAAVITVLVLLGQVLELRAREQTGGAIRALLKLAPKTARRCVKVMRPAVGVEAHRQAVLAEHLLQRPEGRGRALLRDQKRRVDRARRVVHGHGSGRAPPGLRARHGASRPGAASSPAAAAARAFRGAFPTTPIH